MKIEKEKLTERRKTKRNPTTRSCKYAYQLEPGGLFICRGPSVEEIKKRAKKYEEETGKPWGPLLGAADY